MRKDWLDNLGLSMPKTVDEFYNVLRAFTFDDPDGNGRHDTYGLAGGVNFSYLWQVFSAFGVQPGDFQRVGNELHPDYIRPEMRTALAFLSRLYSEGIMDKDTLVMNGNQIEDKAVRGIIGLFGSAAAGLVIRIYPNMLTVNPNAQVELFVPPPSTNGNVIMPVGRNGGGMRGVSARCNNMDAVMRYFNWMIEQDTSALPLEILNADKVLMGTIGVDTQIVGGKYLTNISQNMLTPAAAADLYRFAYRTHVNTVISDKQLFERTQTEIDAGTALPPFLWAQQNAAKYGRPSAVAITGPVYAEYVNDLNTYWQETIASIVTGAKPITAWDDFVRWFYANGGQKIIDEVTRLNM